MESFQLRRICCISKPLDGKRISGTLIVCGCHFLHEYHFHHVSRGTYIPRNGSPTLFHPAIQLFRNRQSSTVSPSSSPFCRSWPYVGHFSTVCASPDVVHPC